MRRFLRLLALVIATPVGAADLTRTTDGAHYFNRPGADLKSMASDLAACRGLADQMHQPGPNGAVTTAASQAGYVGAGIAGELLVLDAAHEIADAKGRSANVENCMVVAGWRVAVANADDARDLTALPQKERLARLAAWTSADAPPGTIIRAFDNDAMRESPAHLFTAAGPHSASLDEALIDRNARAGPASGLPTPTVRNPSAEVIQDEPPRSARPPKPLPFAARAAIPAGMGLIAITLKGPPGKAVILERTGLWAGAPSPNDGRPTRIVAFTTDADLGAGPAGLTKVFTVPPGRWRIARIDVWGAGLSLCLGAPAFDLTAGEAVRFTVFDPPNLIADGDDSAAAAFPPGSTAAARLRPAEWINGTQGVCDGAWLYALEIPNHRFLLSYRVGSRATSPASH